MQDYIPIQKDINERLPTVTVKQYDNLSRFIHIQIFDKDLPDDEKYFNLENCTARLYIQPKGDDSGEDVAYIDGEVADGEIGIVTFLLPSSITEIAGNYEGEIWIYGNDSSHPIISTKTFDFVVEKSIRNNSAIEGTSKFTALDNALIRIAVDKARLNNLEAMVDTGHILPGTVDSEVVDIRTGYNGNTYDSAGNAVRTQISDIYTNRRAATNAEIAAAMDEDYDENEEIAAVLNDLQQLLGNAETLQFQIDQVGRRIDNIGAYLPNGVIDINKLTPPLRVPSSSLSFGTIAEMLKCAETYFNFAYGTANGEYGNLLYKTGVGMYSESLGNDTVIKDGKGNEIKIKDANGKEITDEIAKGKYGVVCSSFVESVLNGITCENSRYKGKEKNIQQPWGVVFDDTVSFGRTENPSTTEIENRYLTSHALAKYADEHGWLYPIDSAHKVKPGDVVFSGHSTDPLRFHGIEHVAIAINVSDDYLTVLEAWNDAAEQTHSKVNMNGTTRYCGLRIKRWSFEIKSGEGDNAVVNKVWTYGATFPVGGVYNAPMLCYHSRDISGTIVLTAETIAANNNNPNNVFTSIYSSGPLEPGFYTFVCRGTFPSKTSDATGKTFPNAKVVVTYDKGHPQEYLLQAGDVYYETFYVQQAGTASIAIQGTNQTYNLSDIALYKGYADVSTFSVVSKDSVGMELSATDDLDNCFEGVYYCNNATTAKSVGHTPRGNSDTVTSGFRMESVRLCRNNRFMQTLTYIEQPEKVYVRQYTAKVTGTDHWDSWYRYEGQIVT